MSGERGVAEWDWFTGGFHHSPLPLSTPPCQQLAETETQLTDLLCGRVAGALSLNNDMVAFCCQGMAKRLEVRSRSCLNCQPSQVWMFRLPQPNGAARGEGVSRHIGNVHVRWLPRQAERYGTETTPRNNPIQATCGNMVLLLSAFCKRTMNFTRNDEKTD